MQVEPTRTALARRRELRRAEERRERLEVLRCALFWILVFAMFALAGTVDCQTMPTPTEPTGRWAEAQPW